MRDTVLQSTRKVSMMKYIPETKKILVVSEGADSILVLSEDFNVLSKGQTLSNNVSKYNLYFYYCKLFIISRYLLITSKVFINYFFNNWFHLFLQISIYYYYFFIFYFFIIQISFFIIIHVPILVESSKIQSVYTLSKENLGAKIVKVKLGTWKLFL